MILIIDSIRCPLHKPKEHKRIHIFLIFIPFFFHLTNFYFFPVFFILFSFEGDFEDMEDKSDTAEAIAALKESILNMLAGLQ